MQQAQVQATDSTEGNQEQDISSEHQYFSFIVREQEYAVDILRVVEIRGWTGAREVPGLPSYMKGVIDLRGEVVPIIDLRERFAMPSLRYDQLTVVVILKVNGENGEKTLGIIVDAVSDVYTIYDNQLRPAPDFGGDIDMNYVTNLATVDEKMIILLDVDELLGRQMPSHIEIREDLIGSTDTIDSQTQDDVTLLETSFKSLAPKGPELVARFYEELFRRYPDVKPMFEGSSIEEQERKLLSALQLVISNLRKPDQLGSALKSLGAKHQSYGAEAAHYDAVAGVLLDVLHEFAGDLWTAAVQKAWTGALGTIKDSMLSAYSIPQETHQQESSPQKPDATELLETSFAALAPQADQVVARFYQELFRRHPTVKPLFAGSDLVSQQQKLVAALKLVINNLRNPTKLERTLKELGKKHQAYGAIDQHYDAVSNVLLDVLREFAGDIWTNDHQTAWRDALTTIKGLMLSGYEEGLSNQQINLLEKSFDLLAPRADELVAKFYSKLFKKYPAVKSMFAKTNPKEQKKKLIAALKLVVNSLRNPVKLTTALQELGRKHQDYGALPTHYDAVASTLLDCMAEIAEDDWTNNVNEAWEAALKIIKEIMLTGYRK